MRDGGGGQILLDGRHLLGGDAFHVVPKSLTGKLRQGQGQEARQDGLLIPVSHLSLTTGSDTAVEGGEEQVVADRGPLGTSLGDVTINGGNDLESLGDGEKGGRSAKFPECKLGRFGTQEAVEDGLGCPQINGGDDLGLTVHALALAQIVVGLAAQDLFW